MAGSTKAALVRGRIVRFTLLDACGNPQTTSSMYVTDGFVAVNPTKNMDAGDEIKVRQANGIIGVHEPGQASLLNMSLEIQFTFTDAGAIAMLTGDLAVLDYQGNMAGWEERALRVLTQNFALEVWTGSSAARCTLGSAISGYMLYPLLSQAYVTFDNITDKEVTGTIHAMSYGNPQWGRGPYGTGTQTTRTVNDAVTTGTNSSPIITSATAAFTSGDLGKLIVNPQFAAGVGYVGLVNSPTSITVYSVVTGAPLNAIAAGTAEALTIGVSDGSSVSGPVATSPGGLPGRLLVAVDPTAHRHFEETIIAPPAAQAGAGPSTIVLPSPY